MTSPFSSDAGSALAPPPALLRLLQALARAALEHGKGGYIVESNAPADFLKTETYHTETHLALLLWLLGRLAEADRSDYEQHAGVRLQRWNELCVAPRFFNAMAVSLLGILVRTYGGSQVLRESISNILRRRLDASEIARVHRCGNNMYLQQRCVDLLCAPLAEGRAVNPDALRQLENAFRSCISNEGFFFDLPRPHVP